MTVERLLDPVPISFAMSLTVLTTTAVFLVDTFVRRDNSAGRLWALAFLALGVSTLGPLATYVLGAEFWLVTAMGRACFVGFFAAFWIGARRFNGASFGWSTGVGLGIVVAVFIGGVGAGATGLDLLRLVPLFAGAAVLAAFGAVESRRGRMARRETVLLTVVLVAVVLFDATALVVHAVPGLIEMPELAGVFTPFTATIISMPVAVVAVATTMALRAVDRLGLAAPLAGGELRVDSAGVLDAESFDRVLGVLAARAERAGRQVAVIAMTVEDLREIGVALGATAHDRLVAGWRASWLRHLPVQALPGRVGRDCLVFVLHPSTIGEANRIGNRLYGRVVEDLAAIEGVVLPVTGFGFVMSGTVPASELVAAARAAARSAALGTAPHQVDEADEAVERTLPPRG